MSASYKMAAVGAWHNAKWLPHLKKQAKRQDLKMVWACFLVFGGKVPTSAITTFAHTKKLFAPLLCFGWKRRNPGSH